MNYEEMNLWEIAALIAKAQEDELLYVKLEGGDLAPLRLDTATLGRIIFTCEPAKKVKSE